MALTEDLATIAPARVWSEQQQAIFQQFAVGHGHVTIVAYAGCGKTTSAIEGIHHAPEQNIMLCAFNKRIQEELARRIQIPTAQAKTLHALGYGCIRKFWNVNLCSPGYRRGASLTEAVCGDQAPIAVKKLVTTLHTKAREMAPLAAKVGDLTDIAYQFDCVPDEEWLPWGYDVATIEALALKAMQLAAEKKPAEGIDYADMIFLPVRNRWMRPFYDLIVVDECQDMSHAQLALAQGLASGRIVVIGDPNQAIYSFRGADSQSIARLKRELNAAELGLTTTYRCGRAIVAEAQRFVPDFEAGPHNSEGLVRDIRYEQLVGEAGLGDFVLSRKNAPLASVAMAFIREQKRVQVAGKDIGKGLTTILDNLTKEHRGRAPDKTVLGFLERLVEWEGKEIARALKADREEQVEQIQDKGETLRVLCENASYVDEVKARIDGLFTDDGLGAKGVITCSSVHKAKGLEAERVFVLKDTLKPFVKRGKTGPVEPSQEEKNIEYVACTRAKDELVYVHGLPGDRR